MKKRILALLWVLALLMALSGTAMAASTTQATEPIQVTKDCELTVTYRSSVTAFAGKTVRLYQVAAVSRDFQYTYTGDFAACALPLNGVTSQAEWNVLRSTLEAHIIANDPAPVATAETDRDGQVVFTGLEPGLYFIPAMRFSFGGSRYAFTSMLAALPELNEADGSWNYSVSAAPKYQVTTPSSPSEPEDTDYRVIKLWKGDSAASRPESVTMELFRDGEAFTTVLLSAENGWTYAWSDDTGSDWTVAERQTSAGYVPSVEVRDNTFIVTNTGSAPGTPGSSNSPYTGDSTPVGLYTMLLCISGLVLVILGVTGRRKAQ